MADELPIPPVALAHPSVEMIRVWLAKQKQQVVLNIGFWEERGIDERESWGVMIADMIHHIANAFLEEYGYDREETISAIRRSLEAEMQAATSKRVGQFVKAKADEPKPKASRKKT